MSSADHSTAVSDLTHKGKGRAQILVNEHTPLLHNVGSSTYTEAEGTAVTPNITHRRLRSGLTFVFLASLAFCISLVLIVAFLGWSYAAKVSSTSPEQIVREALVVRGPDQVDIVKVTSSGALLIDFDLRLGLDAGAVIGVNKAPDDGVLYALWKAIGRWGIRRMGKTSVTLSSIEVVDTHSSSSLMSALVQPIDFPLTVNPPPEKSWLTRMTVTSLILPTNNADEITHFLRHSWRTGYIDVRASVDDVHVQGGSLDEASWRIRFKQNFRNIRMPFRVLIPSLPGLPSPGQNTSLPPVSELVTLQSFNICSKLDRLSIQANATVINPVPLDLSVTMPSLPFIIALRPLDDSNSPSAVPVASVQTAPFSLTHPNITLQLSGEVLPINSTSTSVLSTFLSRFLSGEANPVAISSRLLPQFSVEAMFPGPKPKPQVLRNVTIRDMKIKPGTPFLASGTILARIVLPKGINVDLDISRVFPDVLVFDGEVPEDFSPGASASMSHPTTMSSSPPSPPPLPDPLPERAFGHIKPDDWLRSLSLPAESEEGEGSAFAVTARIVDIPLEVLPGREKEFSNFVGKVIFGSGALAGISGFTAVAVKVHGLPIPGPGDGHEMELSGLPFKGSVIVGKKTF